MRALLAILFALAATPAVAQQQKAFDPCSGITRTSLPISQATSSKLISGTTGKLTYICSIKIVPADAEVVSIVEGTGTVCATGIAAVDGSTTAANGSSLAANGGWVHGDGTAWIMAGKSTGTDICLLQSGTGRISGVLTYAQY